MLPAARLHHPSALFFFFITSRFARSCFQPKQIRENDADFMYDAAVKKIIRRVEESIRARFGVFGSRAAAREFPSIMFLESLNSLAGRPAMGWGAVVIASSAKWSLMTAPLNLAKRAGGLIPYCFSVCNFPLMFRGGSGVLTGRAPDFSQMTQVFAILNTRLRRLKPRLKRVKSNSLNNGCSALS